MIEGTTISEQQAFDSASQRRFTTFGWTVTGLYLSGMALYSWFELDHLLKLHPDAFATYLSGIFAPLAFLWVVLGFKLSEHQIAAVRAEQRRQETENIRLNNPDLVLTLEYRSVTPRHSGGRMALDQPHQLPSIPQFLLKNIGAHCTDLKIFVGGEFATSSPVMETGQTFEWTAPDNVEPIEVVVIYQDRTGVVRSQAFQVSFYVGYEGRPMFSPPKKTPGIVSLDVFHRAG